MKRARYGKSRGYYKVGAPYQVNGVWYYPRVDYTYDETGTASWYGEAFNGKSTANGEIFDLTQVSAAHKTLQLPSVVEVTNLQNSRALKVRVNDRGPFAGDRIIDLSRRAAQLLGFERAGTAPVRVRIIKDESIKVAEAAMRGDIGSSRLASEPRSVQTQYAATVPRPSGIRAAPPTGVAVASAAAPASTPSAPAPVILAASPGPVPIPPPSGAEPPQGASERSAMPAENAPIRRPAWPSLIASAHAATPAAALPTLQQTSTAVQPGRIFIQAGMFAVAENANRLRARFAGLTGTEVVRDQRQRQCPVPGQAGAGGERDRGAASARQNSPRAGYRTPASSAIDEACAGKGRKGPERDYQRKDWK